MKDRNSTVLYTKETRGLCNLLCVHRAYRAYRAAEQQSNRATEHSAGHVTQRSAGLGSWSQRTSLPPDLLPEASSHASASSGAMSSLALLSYSG